MRQDLTMQPSAKTSPRLLAWLPAHGLAAALRYIYIFGVALLLFALILWLAGKDPLLAIKDTFMATLGTGYGLSEVIVKMIPLVFTAIAVALPSRVGLINVGGEGQLYIVSLL